MQNLFTTTKNIYHLASNLFQRPDVFRYDTKDFQIYVKFQVTSQYNQPITKLITIHRSHPTILCKQYELISGQKIITTEHYKTIYNKINSNSKTIDYYWFQMIEYISMPTKKIIILNNTDEKVTYTNKKDNDFWSYQLNLLETKLCELKLSRI